MLIAPYKRPEVLRVNPSEAAGLGARLLLEWGAGEDEEEEEEEEAAGEEVRAVGGAGEASRSPDSISLVSILILISNGILFQVILRVAF